MFLELLGLVLALSHIVTIAAIVIWFALRRPTSWAVAWHRFKREFLSLRPS